MKRPTPAAWKKMLLAYEPILNVLIAEEGLTRVERDAMFRVHHVLRRRASGKLDRKSVV